MCVPCTQTSTARPSAAEACATPRQISACSACNAATAAGACQTCTKGVCGPAPSSTVCRAASNSCDQAENCTGNSPDCPADGFKDSSTVLRTPTATATNTHHPPTAPERAPPARQPQSPPTAMPTPRTLTGCKSSCVGAADCASLSVCNPDLSACGGLVLHCVSAGSQTTCASCRMARPDAGVETTAANSGWPGRQSGEPPDPTVFPVVNLSNAMLMGAGQTRSCAVLSDKSVSCWGWGIGDSSATTHQRCAPAPVQFPPQQCHRDSLGASTHCVVAADSSGASTVSCWESTTRDSRAPDPDVAPEEDTPHAITGFYLLPCRSALEANPQHAWC